MTGRTSRLGRAEVKVVRTIDDYLRAVAVRSRVYMGEQACPFDEEFDGNDLCGATHLLAFVDEDPVATLRMRWFATFAKIERVAVLSTARTGDAARPLIAAAIEMAARKGYQRILGHADAQLVEYWKRTQSVTVREGRPPFCFSGREYIEIELRIAPSAEAITPESEPLVLLRPEGAWDMPGVLDRSAGASASPREERAWATR